MSFTFHRLPFEEKTLEVPHVGSCWGIGETVIHSFLGSLTTSGHQDPPLPLPLAGNTCSVSWANLLIDVKNPQRKMLCLRFSIGGMGSFRG